MNAFQTFMQLLYNLQHTTTQAVDIRAGGGWNVAYGGSAIQAFLYAIQSHAQLLFEWAPNVRF